MNTANQRLPTDLDALTGKERVQTLKDICKPIARAFRPYIAGYRALVKKLRSEEFRLRLTCLAAPVQLEGRLPSGERFYFRCRYSRCALRIAPPRGDPVRTPTWEQDVERWEGYEAGSLEAEETEAVLRELLGAYEASRTKTSSS